MNYRDPKDESGRFAAWLRALRGVSGVYLIRSKGGLWSTPELVYIGESHTGRLYQTITRHFQGWEGRLTYGAHGMKVAVRTVRDPARAIDLQYSLIRKLKPRDNVIEGTTITEEVPF